MIETLISSLANLLQRGGWVMYPLLLMSIVALTICLERGWFWLRTGHGRRGSTVTDLCQALRHGETARVRSSRALKSIYGQVAVRLAEVGSSDAIALEAVDAERPRYERFMTLLSTIISTAPLLGILGTVTGIIASFELLGENQMVTDPKQVSGGIAEALLTTAFGLVIALAALFPYMAFRTQVDRALSAMELLVASAKDGAATAAETASDSSARQPSTAGQTG